MHPALPVVLLGLFALWLFPAIQVILAWSGRKGGPPVENQDPQAEIQHFFLLVPAMNEGTVIRATVEDLLTLKAPGAQVAVWVINDASTDDTAEVLASIDNPRLYVLNRKLPNAQRGKGRALNDAFQRICETVKENQWDPHKVAIGVIDADGRCSDNLLSEAKSFFYDPQVAAVQSRVWIRNTDSFWGLAQHMEFSHMVNATQNMRDRVGSVALGGNGQFVRLAALQVLGNNPWSDCLVEDLDLGVRIHQNAGTIRYTSAAHVDQQAVTHLRPLLKQRTRWSQGNIQCLSYVPSVTSSSRIRPRARLEMLSYLSIGFLGIAGSIATVVGIYFMISHPSLEEIPDVIMWIAALVLPGVMWAVLFKRANPNITLKQTAVLSIGYSALVVVSITSMLRAWYRHVRHKNSWDKTAREAESPVT